jgi:D-lactate dehydrogenase
MTFVLPHGMVFNSGKPEDYEKFEREAKSIADEIRALRTEILQNNHLLERIRKKYKQKNTVGYGLNAL